MSVVSWSPELRNVVRDLKKIDFRNVRNVASSLSETEMKAIQKTFETRKEKVTIQSFWQ